MDVAGPSTTVAASSGRAQWSTLVPWLVFTRLLGTVVCTTADDVIMWTPVKLLRFNHVPKDFREPFIMSGYRSCRSSVFTCLLSAFSYTNETINFWTHFIPFGFFLYMYGRLRNQLDFTGDSFTYPLQVYLVSVCMYTFASAVAHLFNCISERGRHICFFLDYGGLSIYSLACSIMYNYYVFPEYFQNTRFHEWYIYICIFNALLCTVLACLSRLVVGVPFQKVFRLMAFMLPYVFCSFPLLHRCLACEGADCHPESIYFHTYQFILCATMITVYATHFPEVVAPGRFDFLGHSHQLFHVASAMATYCQMNGGIIDMQYRRSYLLTVWHEPTAAGTFGIFLAVIVVDLGIIAAFTSLIWHKQQLRQLKQKQGYLTNRKSTEKQG